MTAQPDRLTEALDIVRAALEHRRDYEARDWSHVDCGAEEDIRERLALAALAESHEPLGLTAASLRTELQQAWAESRFPPMPFPDSVYDLTLAALRDPHARLAALLARLREAR